MDKKVKEADADAEKSTVRRAQSQRGKKKANEGLGSRQVDQMGRGVHDHMC
mgnify:CR=1 FL=1